MSGYTPVFDTVLDGTLCGKWPHTGVWLCLLSQADRHGHIDVVPTLLAAKIGVSIDVLQQCINDFMEPDPDSRTPDHDGRRLELLSPKRNWGWRVVNHSKYREKARKKAYDDDRTESGHDAARKAASREVPRSPAPSRAGPLSESESDSETNIRTRASAQKADSRSERAGVPRGTVSEDRIVECVQTVKAYWPKGGRENWMSGEHLIRNLIDEGTSPEVIEQGVKRYRDHCRSTGRATMNPSTFFSAGDKPWLQEWAIPKADKGAAQAAAREDRDAATMAEATRRAQAIGFRDRYPDEPVAAYLTDIMLAENARPAATRKVDTSAIVGKLKAGGGRA